MMRLASPVILSPVNISAAAGSLESTANLDWKKGRLLESSICTTFRPSRTFVVVHRARNIHHAEYVKYVDRSNELNGCISTNMNVFECRSTVR